MIEKLFKKTKISHNWPKNTTVVPPYATVPSGSVSRARGIFEELTDAEIEELIDRSLDEYEWEPIDDREDDVQDDRDRG